ncbi:MAG: hypothetical protein IJC45_06465 [Clostridia bacterium]|nr:hypothetical protein [Clostridia bacterium]
MEYLNKDEIKVLAYLRQYYQRDYALEISILDNDYKKIKGVRKECVHNLLRALVIRDFLRVVAFDTIAPDRYRHFCFTQKALQYSNSVPADE